VQIDVSIVVSLVTGAATLGIALGRQVGHTERLKSLERFRERCGERLERLEKNFAVERVRSATRGEGHQAVTGRASNSPVPELLEDPDSSE
jgi:hypothetical protein